MRCQEILKPKHGVCLALFVVLLFAQDRAVTADDFAAYMDAVMARMHHDMMVPPTGNPDRDFTTMMNPHHQGAIDMAKIEPQFSHDPVGARDRRRATTRDNGDAEGTGGTSDVVQALR